MDDDERQHLVEQLGQWHEVRTKLTDAVGVRPVGLSINAINIQCRLDKVCFVCRFLQVVSMAQGEPDPGATPVAGYFTCAGEGDAAEQWWTRLPICWPHLIEMGPEVAEKGSHVFENEDGAESAPVLFEPIGGDDGRPWRPAIAGSARGDAPADGETRPRLSGHPGLARSFLASAERGADPVRHIFSRLGSARKRVGSARSSHHVLFWVDPASVPCCARRFPWC